MKTYDYILVGAGLYCGVIAHELTKIGKACLVLEQRSHIGGNLYCETIEGIEVHQYGAHIFHTNDEAIWTYVNRLTQFNNYINSPIAFYKGSTYNLPFNMNTFSKMWGITTPSEAHEIIQKQCMEVSGTPQNLEEQAIHLVGRDIYEKLIKGYTEKQWGRDCKDLPSFIIKRIPVRYTYNNNYFNDRYQGIPIGGYNPLIHKLFEGCDIKLNTNYLENKAYYNTLGKKVIYSGMIDAYYDYCYGKLEYRSLKFENEILDTPNYQGVAVVNYTDKEIPFTRIIEHKHFEFGTQPHTVITREYPAPYKEGMQPYYPINDTENLNLYAKYQSRAQQEKNVLFGGRLGSYAYYDMDKVIAEALKTVQTLL